MYLMNQTHIEGHWYIGGKQEEDGKSHFKRTFDMERKDPFCSVSGESGAFILANAYPENIKAIGSTGRTNLKLII